ncbi:MAG: hypothetical protein HY301_01395 [Verrucomicrobia bacterium]|nr:hypothetical protein [Verrucomicrobiota bacterium]
MKRTSAFCRRWLPLLLLLALSASAPAQELLDKLDDALFVQSPGGFFRTDLSGRLDLEGYYHEGNPPGLIFPTDNFFFNPRLSLFLDARLGEQFYSFVQFRADRGFDVGLKQHNGDARFDEYLLRWTPWRAGELNVQVGKFATAVGNWVPRHLAWENPFITAPAPYENVTVITDQAAPASPAAMLARRNIPDRKGAWLPVVWGPSYASGASVFGRVEKFDYALEVKNASISSRPSAWDATELGWSNPTVSGRVGVRPSAAWNFGASFSRGAYLLPAAKPTLPAGTSLGDFPQITLAADANWSWRHWQVWAEIFASRFDVPNVGNADTLAYYVETKYKFTPHLFGALRWNQQFFGKIPNGLGGEAQWDRNLWRADAALGWRFTRHVQAKVQYSYSHQQGYLQQGEQMVATQVSVKF